MNKIFFVIIAFTNIFAQNFVNWYDTDSLNTARYEHTSVMLADGNILVAGGSGEDTTLFSCEIYDYEKSQWRESTNMNSARRLFKMVLLPNNKVLAIGGWNNRSCEIFDPETENWGYTDSLQEERWDSFTATLLQNGNVLICGGYYLTLDGNPAPKLNSCEIFDYQSEEWSYAEAMSNKKTGHTATLLPDGNVLVIGGVADAVKLNVCEFISVRLKIKQPGLVV